MVEHVNESVVGAKEGAALFGVRPSNFVRDWAARPDFPAPVATLARGRHVARLADLVGTVTRPALHEGRTIYVHH
jgi:hypothetical protein